MCRDSEHRLSIVATLAVAMLVVTGCAVLPARTSAERAADEQLAGQVEDALLRDPDIYARHIDVDAERGVVHLSGYVWSANEVYEARRVAATVPGVTQVVSQLELMVGGRSGSR